MHPPWDIFPTVRHMSDPPGPLKLPSWVRPKESAIVPYHGTFADSCCFGRVGQNPDSLGRFSRGGSDTSRTLEKMFRGRCMLTERFESCDIVTFEALQGRRRAPDWLAAGVVGGGPTTGFDRHGGCGTKRRRNKKKEKEKEKERKEDKGKRKIPEPDPSDRSAPGASTMEAPHQSLFQKGPKPAQLQVRLLSHILASSLSAQKAASSLPSNPMPTCPCPVLTGHRSCAFLHGVCHACQRVTNAGEQESGAPRSVLAASRETSSRASKREQAPGIRSAAGPVSARVWVVGSEACGSYRQLQYTFADNRRSGPAALDLHLRPGATCLDR